MSSTPITWRTTAPTRKPPSVSLPDSLSDSGARPVHLCPSLSRRHLLRLSPRRNRPVAPGLTAPGFGLGTRPRTRLLRANLLRRRPRRVSLRLRQLRQQRTRLRLATVWRSILSALWLRPKNSLERELCRSSRAVLRRWHPCTSAI